MKHYYFNLNMPYDDCINLYTGDYKQLVVKDDNGLKIQIPIHNMRRFVTRVGLKGRFRLTINEQNKIQSLEKIA